MEVVVAVMAPELAVRETIPEEVEIESLEMLPAVEVREMSAPEMEPAPEISLLAEREMSPDVEVAPRTLMPSLSSVKMMSSWAEAERLIGVLRVELEVVAVMAPELAARVTLPDEVVI